VSIDLGSRYCRNYCEENVWHLCGDCVADRTPAFAVFISNADRAVAIWQQRAARSAGAPLVWDYHVILIARSDPDWRVYDVDSRLAPGVPAREYIETCFPVLPPVLAPHAPHFRVVEAARYRATLATDRSHMRLADGTWRSPPPAGPPIGEGTNLMRFVDTQEDFEGEVLDRAALLARFAP